MPAGRPSKYKPEFCEDLIEHMASGKDIESFGGHLYNKYGRKYAVHADTVFEWLKVHEEFSEAKKVGRALSLYWHEDVYQKALEGKLRTWKEAVNESGQVVTLNVPHKLETTAWIFAMKNKFGWRDKQDIDHTSNGETLNIADLCKKAAQNKSEAD